MAAAPAGQLRCHSEAVARAWLAFRRICVRPACLSLPALSCVCAIMSDARARVRMCAGVCEATTIVTRQTLFNLVDYGSGRAAVVVVGQLGELIVYHHLRQSVAHSLCSGRSFRPGCPCTDPIHPTQPHLLVQTTRFIAMVQPHCYRGILQGVNVIPSTV
jgi:hypothetical protein